MCPLLKILQNTGIFIWDIFKEDSKTRVLIQIVYWDERETG